MFYSEIEAHKKLQRGPMYPPLSFLQRCYIIILSKPINWHNTVLLTRPQTLLRFHQFFHSFVFYVYSFMKYFPICRFEKLPPQSTELFHQHKLTLSCCSFIVKFCPLTHWSVLSIYFCCWDSILYKLNHITFGNWLWLSIIIWSSFQVVCTIVAPFHYWIVFCYIHYCSLFLLSPM